MGAVEAIDYPPCILRYHRFKGTHGPRAILSAVVAKTGRLIFKVVITPNAQVWMDDEDDKMCHLIEYLEGYKKVKLTFELPANIVCYHLAGLVDDDTHILWKMIHDKIEPLLPSFEDSSIIADPIKTKSFFYEQSWMWMDNKPLLPCGPMYVDLCYSKSQCNFILRSALDSGQTLFNENVLDQTISIERGIILSSMVHCVIDHCDASYHWVLVEKYWPGQKHTNLEYYFHQQMKRMETYETKQDEQEDDHASILKVYMSQVCICR
jgi:hypothetical protein